VITEARSSTSTTVAVVDPAFSDAERHALVAFRAGYRGLTREAYALDLRQFIAWCEQHALRLFEVRRADIDCYARDLEERGRARATVARRMVNNVPFDIASFDDLLQVIADVADISVAMYEAY
jgi:Phage integrase, N-terminal SAM-like domain